MRAFLVPLPGSRTKSIFWTRANPSAIVGFSNLFLYEKMAADGKMLGSLLA
jgi:hypothetical protein